MVKGRSYGMHSTYEYDDVTSVIDFTEIRLKKMIRTSTDTLQINNLTKMLNDYLLGNIMICWQTGIPWIQRVIVAKTNNKHTTTG